MWQPKSEAEILQRIAHGDLEETHTLEFKSETGTNTKEIAKDICAMTIDGGVIIYGIAEDDGHRPVSKPIQLSGQPERIDQIALSGIHEPPTITVTPVRTNKDQDRGYLVVNIPPSPRAPHMVTARGDNRYYGRGDKSVRRLGQSEVERLYQRRLQWEQDREALVIELIEAAPLKPHDTFGFLHVVVKPLFSDHLLLERVLGKTAEERRDTLREIYAQVNTREGFGQANHYPGVVRPTSDGLIAYLKAPPTSEKLVPESVLNIELFYDGSARLFYGGAAEHFEQYQGPIIFEFRIVDVLLRLLDLLAELYRRANNFGPIDLGLAVTGIQNGLSHACKADQWNRISLPRYRYRDYRMTTRTLGLEIQQRVEPTAKRMLDRFLQATTQGEYRPFDEDLSPQ